MNDTMDSIYADIANNQKAIKKLQQRLKQLKTRVQEIEETIQYMHLGTLDHFDELETQMENVPLLMEYMYANYKITIEALNELAIKGRWRIHTIVPNTIIVLEREYHGKCQNEN